MKSNLLLNIIVAFVLFAGIVPIVLFAIKWNDTDFDTAWDTFYDFVGKCLNT